jgi:hypothetical protein
MAMKEQKVMILAVCLSILCSGVALAGGAASADALAEKVHAAITAKDAEAISSLYNWEGVPPEIAGQLKEAVQGMTQDPVLRVEVRPLPEDFPVVQELGEQKFVQNVDLEGVVVLIFTEDGTVTGTMPYGTTKDGTYYFSAPVPQ